MPRLDGRVVLAHRERVHVQILAQIGDAATADGRVLLVIDHVLVNHGVLAGSTGAAAVERPGAAQLEQARLPARQISQQQIADDLVEATLAVVVNLAHRGSERALHRGRCHQRIERRLARAGGHHHLDVVNERVLGLRREVEDHVRVHRDKIRARFLNALEDLLAAAVLLVAIHLAQQVVVEGLHANGKALHASFQLLQILVGKVIRIRLARNFFDREQVASHVDGLAQLVDHDGGRAAADVDRIEIVAEILQHAHLASHVLEVGLRAILAEGEAIEGAVGAQTLAERHMHVQHVRLTRVGRGHERLVAGLKLQVVGRASLHHLGKHSF